MANNKGTRSDSATSAIDAMKNAAKKPLVPPKQCPLRKEDLPFWNSIITSRSREEWTEVDLVIAAQLARTQADYEAEHTLLYQERPIEYDQHGRSFVNARCRYIDLLAKKQLALMRALRIAGIAGTPRDNLTKRQLEQQAREIRAGLMDDEDEDELLARPR